MVLDPHHAVADDQDLAPRTLRRPADPPPPLPHVRDGEALQSLSRELEGRRVGASSRRGALRAWAGRVSGRSDRRLLLALAQATEVVATHCDLLADRLAAQEAVGADVAATFGEEITRLRAEVLHLRRLVAQPDAPHE